MNNISKKVVAEYGSFNGFAAFVDAHNEWTAEQKLWFKGEVFKSMCE